MSRFRVLGKRPQARLYERNLTPFQGEGLNTLRAVVQSMRVISSKSGTYLYCLDLSRAYLKIDLKTGEFAAAAEVRLARNTICAQ